MKTDLRKPCNDCPFRRTSPRGWLGPWTAPDLLFSLGWTPFPCHQTIRREGQSYDDNTLQGCAGAAIFLNNKCERARAGNGRAPGGGPGRPGRREGVRVQLGQGIPGSPRTTAGTEGAQVMITTTELTARLHTPPLNWAQPLRINPGRGGPYGPPLWFLTDQTRGRKFRRGPYRRNSPHRAGKGRA